jgi:hypothetical protein
MRLTLFLAAGITTVALRPASTAPQISSLSRPDARIELGITGRANAFPSVAADGRFVALAWGATKDSTTDVYVAISRDGGSVFGSPVLTSGGGSAAKLSGEQPPRVTLIPRRGKDPAIIVVWTTATSQGTRLVSARSDDGGRTYGASRAVPGTQASGNRGWEAIATEREGSVVAVWLDHRELAKSDGGHGSHSTHAHPAAGPRADGAERAQLSKLFFARMDDPGSARPLTGGVCYCCKTALTTGPDGAIYAAWRHVYPGNRRDIAFAMSRDRGRTFGSPVRVSEDQWQLDGCPENGPAIALDSSSRVHVIWPTLITEAGRETLALYHAVSRDGRTFSRRARVPAAGPAYHPQVIAMPRGELLVAWEEFRTGGRIVRFARGLPATGGSMTFTAVPLSVDSRGTYPAIAATASGALAVWVTPASRLAAIQASPQR